MAKTKLIFTMMSIRQTVFLLTVFMFSAIINRVSAQADAVFLNPKMDIEVLLPQLDSLFSIAKAANPSLKQYDLILGKGKEEVQLQKYKKEAEEMELKRKLCGLYADMVGYNRIYKGRNEDFITQSISCQVAEKEFREGSIRMAEYSRQKNILANAEAAYHDSFRLYFSALKQFEAILGVPLNKVMIKSKNN